MSLLQEEYKLAIDNKMLSPKVSEQDFEKMLKDDTKRKEYWDYCNKKNPSFYAEDYNRFSQLTNEMLGEANKPSVEENPAPTTAQEDSINLAKQNEGEQQLNVVTPTVGEQIVQPSSTISAEPTIAPIQKEEKKEEQSTLDRGMQIIDDAWDKSGFLGKVFLSPMKLAEVGISLVQGAASGVVEWGGRGAMSLMAQAVENNKAGNYDTFKVDAMGNPMFVPKIGEDGQYEKAGYSIEEQIEAAKRVEQAEAEGKEADIKDKNASMYVRAANKLEKVADRLHKSSMPNDVAEDATFIDLIREGEVMDAVQLSVASTGQSIPYMLLNSLPGGGFVAGTLGQANTYLDLSKEHPEMEKWKRYTYAIGSSGIEQAVEKFTNPFKGLKGASKKEVAKTLKEITDGAEKAIWKRVTGNVLKEAAGEGGEELATSVFTDIFGTMIDTDGEYGIGIIGQYNEYADQMREQNPTMTNNDILKSFVGNKAKEYAESFIMGALSGAYISTVSSIATRDYAKEEQKNDRIMLDAITTTADANGLVKEDVLGIVMKEQDGELTDEEKNIIKSFNTNYAKATMKSVAEEQGNELVEKIANKSNGYVFEVDFADGSLGETDMAYIVDGAVHTTDVDGKTIIDKTTSDKVVYVKVLKEDGSEEVKQVAIDELNLVGTPMQSSEFALQYQQGIYNTAEQLLDAQEQVVGEDNGQQPLGVTEGEQGRNIEGRQFTNGQQTITASNPDSNGNVTLSAPVTLSNGVVTDQVMPQQVFDDLMNGLISEEGWQEVSSQPTNQGQAQGQQQAPQPISWSEMDANQATATVVERSKGDKERAKKFAQKQVEVKTKALQEAQAEMDAFEGDDLDAFNAAQDKVDAAQAEVDKWTAVANGIDTYNAPVQEAPQPTPSATSASGNRVVTEGTAQAPEVQEPASQDPQQPTQGAQDEPKKITRESVRELLSKEAQEMEKAWNNDEEMDNTDATEVAHDIFWVLGANVNSMMREEIDDYVGEHYPTQATISGETNSEKGKKEREQLKNDKKLKDLENAVKEKQEELDAIVEETRKKIQEICTSPDATAQDIAEVLEGLARYESRVVNLHEQSGSMNNYDMLDKYIGTTKAFQKDVNMQYARKNALNNASAKVKGVIELAGKATEVVRDKEKFAEAYKQREDALNALTVEELEELKDVLRITGKNDFLYQDAENRAASIREEQRRQKKANSLSDIFDNGGTQVDRPTKVKSYKYNPFDFATNDPVRPVMGTAYHEDGHVVSTDAHILVAVKQKYDKKLEGKMTDKDGKVVLESSKFPNWKLVFDGAKTHKADVTAISVDDFRSFLEGAKAKLKAEWQAKKDNGEKVGSFKDYLYNKADVMVRTNGGTHAYRLGRLIDFANALSEIGAKDVFFDGRRDTSAQPMAAETNQGKAMIMPVLVDNISIEEDGRVVVGNSNTAFLYDLADKKTRMAANNSQNTLQNGNNSVPLQGEKSATQKVIDKIDSKHFPVVVFNKKNYREVMRKAGASEKLIKEVGDVLSDLKPHQVMGGFFDEGMIFIQEQTDLDAVRKAYVHERQHAFNASNEQLLLKMAATSYKSQFAAMIRAMAGNNFYDKYGMKYLVDEFVCRAMEIAYSVDTDAELEAELRKIGANDKQIQIIKEINNEQRNDNSLSNARYNSLLNSNDSSRSEQVRRDSQSVSRGVLGEKGNGSAQIGERRDRSRRSSETIGEVAKNFTAEQTLSNAGEQVSADGVRYNIASNDKVVAARETQLKRSVRNGLLTMNEANEIREFAQAMRVIAETIAQAKQADGSAEFPSFSEWNGLEVQLNANGTPLVSAIKSNGEYPMNIDFAKHCIKRDSTSQVLNKLVQVDPELFTSLTTDMLVEINQIINKHGLSVPCVGCFVEARRFRSAEYAKSVVNTWNTLVDAVKKGDKAVKEAKKKLGGKQSVDKIVEHLRNTPSDDVKISESDIISPNKYGELMMKHPSIPTLLQATQGQNNTHLIVPEAIYYGDVLNLSAENSWDVDAAYEVGGVRLQSFSDFKAKLFFDYCQVLADLASKKLPAHSYTKVPSFAELFGLTGMKINLSLYYSGTGLDANGNYTYSDESISPEFAFDLQSREGYTDNVGTMAIGVSDEHIWKLLKDENIRSISPYHKSGINPEVAAKLKADEFVDYTNEQNAVTPKSAKKEGESWQDYYARITKRVDGKVPTIGKKVKPEFNLYDDLIDTNSPIQTAQNYVAYCQENGIVPKFASFVYNADGSFNEEYYKLLFDFSVYNKDGVYAPQGAVKWAEGSMPTNTVDILKQALEVEEGTIAKNQADVDEVVKDILANVFDRDDLAASESQVRYSVVTDKKKIEELEASEKVIGYRNVVLNEDGTFGSPMASSLRGEGGKVATTGFELDMWEQAEENPDLADENGKITLVKPDGKEVRKVDYNPYIHNRPNKVNKQFKQAWERPNLVYIETEIAKIDIEGGYHAEKANKSVGIHKWNGGKLILSRYDKPIRIVPWEEVADDWVKEFKKRGVEFDIVPPALLPILHERGVEILPPHKNMGEECNAAYAQWIAENSNPRFSISNIAEDAWNKYQYDGELESIRDVANYIEENMPKNEQTQALFDAIDAYNEEEFEDRQLYGMRGDLEPFEDAILEELETLMNSKPRFSITAEEDKAYADAVARGDMETAQRMVIEEAKKAMPNTKIVDADGNPMIVYHDTNATELVNIETGENWNDLDWRAKDEWRNREDFEEYWEERDFYTFNDKRSRRSIEMPAYFFSTKEDEYHEYGNRTIRAFLNITNPAIDPTIENAGTYDYAGEDAMNRLIEQGHDGFIRTMNNGEWDEVNAFFPNQIKSADPVTYDDNGNVIPLSERFNNDKSDIRFSIIGERGAANLDRAEEATTRLDNLAVAREMESANKDAKTIKMATGWERGADGKWRYEIEDIKLKDITTLKSSDNVTLGDIVEYNELFTAYPDMSDIVVDKNVSNGDIASYNGNIGLSAELLNMPYTAIRTALVHEIQHAIQDREGFAGGVPSPNAEYFVKRKAELEKAINALENDFTIEQLRELAKTTDDAYLRDVYVDALMLMAEGATMDDVREVYTNEYNGLNEQERQSTKEYVNAAGEVESRNASSRLGMSAEERRATLLSETEDVARKDQLFIFDAMEGANNEIRFSVSNTNQRIFVSNAERAVESIKQEKATPQQWKAMIEKQGGLKAGEDKWLGLSEWLDSKVAPAQENETMGEVAQRVAKNTITKQEILDFIAENQIQIEEVNYTEANSSERLEKLEEYRDEYAMWVRDMEQEIEDGELEEDADVYQLAFDEMVGEYGDDFAMAFDFDWNGELQPIEDMYGNYSAADHFLSGTKAINETRMRYTTEGLENKKEIALTVPTIESWNENDEIHFGEAGGGRAIAWIRFGETQMQTPREVVDHVDELQFAFTNVNGRDVYAPQGSKFSKDYAVYGKLANGEMGYVLYVRDKQLSAHPTLEAALDALNAHYEANPRQVTEYSDVLVIDEIQSKRHQEGREKGYRDSKYEELERERIELSEERDSLVKEILHKFGYKHYMENDSDLKFDMDWLDKAREGKIGSQDEMNKVQQLNQRLLDIAYEQKAMDKGIPDAPFDKNWHELAFKRMLRYAAENGYDYVAWTTGEQQAERYNLGKQFDSIEREDNPSINGRRFALNGANYFTFVVNEEGIITESDMSEIKGKPLADVVGKDLAIRMISLEDGDAIDFVDLRIGGEGMKGFYDRMLPSFVSKYTKKWGAKVQDINLPSLEESAQTMHAVNVTQEMKDSVMEGQVMFSVRNTAEDLRMSPESSIFAEQYDDVPYISFDEDFDTAVSDVQTSYEERFNDVVTDIEMQGAEVDESLLYQKAGVVADYIEDINKDEKYPVVVVPSNKDIYEWMTNKGVSKELARDAQNKLNEKGGDRIRGFHQNGTIFILSQNLDSLLLAKLTYAHEIQHAKNKRNANLIIKVLDAISRKEALDFISKFGNRGVYADLLNEKEEGYYTLADEVVAYAMSEGYKLGMDGNLAQYLRDKGITNEELINILNEEYERQKNDVSDSKRFFGQRDIESYRRSVAGRTQQDGGDLQARSQEMGESAELETLSRGTQGDRGRIARELAEKAQDSLLRIGAKRIARKYELATTPVEHTTMFSVTGAPTPTPTETKGEYLKRYMEWRESQIEQAARTKFVQDMKKADKFFEKAAKKLVDRNKPIDDFQKAVVAQGGKLNVGNNAYADTTMAIGRAGYQVRRFADHQLKDMLDAISEMMDSKLLDNIVLTWDNMDTEYSDPKELIKGKRLTVRELIGVYCQAMDVKEAKEKDLPDRGEAGFKKNLRDANGNEVSYEDVIRMVHDAVAGTNLTKKLWRAINNATKFALRYQLAAGMIDQETFDKYDRDYYVPERGWRERDLDGREEKYNESQGMTNGSPYNAALQKAKGRDSLASDPFAYIQSIAETSILSAEKNKVKQKFLQFVFDNEAIGRKTGAWNIRKVWLVEGANGQPEVSFEKPADESKIIKGYATESQIKLASEVRQRTRAERLQHQVIVMRDGVQYIVELESEELANTLNGKYEGMNDLWEGWGNVQRSMVNYMSAINTQYNPVFPVFNFIRDFQLAMISNIGEQDAKFTAKFMKNIGKVQGAIWKYVANEKIMGREAFLATPMGKYLEEYFEQGAQTGFSFLRDIEALNKDIDKALTEGKFKRGAKKTKDVILGTLSMMTEASELTVRLAQYVTARESGYSAEEAAQMAKEISVNFDRKGTESRALSKLYSFFNASIQGTNKIWRMVKSKKARRTLLGVSALYMALGILNTLMNPDDPEEEIWASDYTRKTNFLLGKVRIPVAHFFRIFYGAGVEIVLAAQGRKTIKQSIFDTANFTADELVPSSLFQVHNLWEYNEVMNEVEFNPAQYVQGAAPSWISPLTDVAMNRNYMGGKINKEPYTTSEEGKYKAGKYAMKNTDERWIDIADLLSGGDSSAAREYGEGKGVSGSTLQHIFEGYIGQAGKFVLDAGALPIKAAKGKEITTKDIPYVNRLIKPYKQESAYNQEYWTLKKDLQHYEFLLDKKKKEDREAYWEERESEQYAAYIRLKRLVNRKPKEGDTHTPEDVRKLMEANKEWRRLK